MTQSFLANLPWVLLAALGSFAVYKIGDGKAEAIGRLEAGGVVPAQRFTRGSPDRRAPTRCAPITSPGMRASALRLAYR